MNAPFFASLALILVIFISMLVKGWFHGFDPGFAPILKPYNRELVREYRYLCFERWRFSLPHLPIISRFFCRLLLFLIDFNAVCFCSWIFHVTMTVITILTAPPYSALGHDLFAYLQCTTRLLLSLGMYAPCKSLVYLVPRERCAALVLQAR